MRRPSTALIVATVALVVALGGTGLAASHYLITSTAQISPKVLRKLEKRGPRGYRGATGPAGAVGATGSQGPGATVINFTSTSDAQTTPELAKTIGPLTLYSLCTAGGDSGGVYVAAATSGWTVTGMTAWQNSSGGNAIIPPTPVSTNPSAPTLIGGTNGTTYMTTLVTNGSATYTFSIALNSVSGGDCTWRGTVTPAAS